LASGRSQPWTSEFKSWGAAGAILPRLFWTVRQTKRDEPFRPSADAGCVPTPKRRRRSYRKTQGITAAIFLDAQQQTQDARNQTEHRRLRALPEERQQKREEVIRRVPVVTADIGRSRMSTMNQNPQRLTDRGRAPWRLSTIRSPPFTAELP